MIRIAKAFLLILSLSLAFVACEKEYSEENGGAAGGGGGTSSGTAVYTWLGAPGSCATPIISGIYTAGTAMTASNTIVLAVDVTTVGTFMVTSGTNNGISFAGSGTFTITGPQIITLTATGTPTAAGTYNYIPGTTGCAFGITFTGGGGPGTAAGTLDCATAVVAGTYTQGIALTGSNTITIPVNVTTAGTWSCTTASINGVQFTGSGTLATGAQTIVLTGSGLPNSAGTNAFAVTLGTSTCSVSVTFAAGTPPAVGTLDCATAVVAGTYTQGIALDASNTITIPVNVTTAGPYLVTTSASNGVVFSGSGTLATGAQTIVLTGSGTPANSGNASIPIVWGTSNCNVDIIFAAGSTDFLRCSIDGGPIVNFSNLSAFVIPGTFTGSGSSGTQDLDIGVTNVGGGAIVTGTYNNLSLTNTNVFCNDQLSSGAQIWVDIDASGSSNIFTLAITSITATTITGTFSGKLTDLIGGGGTKMITNGSFSLTY